MSCRLQHWACMNIAKTMSHASLHPTIQGKAQERKLTKGRGTMVDAGCRVFIKAGPGISSVDEAWVVLAQELH